MNYYSDPSSTGTLSGYPYARSKDEKLGDPVAIAGVIVGIVSILVSIGMVIVTEIRNAKAERDAKRTQAEVDRLTGIISGLESELGALNTTIDKVKALEKGKVNQSMIIGGVGAAVALLLTLKS